MIPLLDLIRSPACEVADESCNEEMATELDSQIQAELMQACPTPTPALTYAATHKRPSNSH